MDGKTAHEHLTTIKAAMQFLYKAQKESADDGAQHGVMVLNVRNDVRSIEIAWVPPENIPEHDAPIRDMGLRCHARDCSLMAVTIFDQGWRNCYLISPMVNWRQFSQGFVVVDECHMPPIDRPPNIIGGRALGAPAPSDRLDPTDWLK